jgi:hypothetical protein
MAAIENAWEYVAACRVLGCTARAEKTSQVMKLAGFLLEATPGIEPGCTDLQSAA